MHAGSGLGLWHDYRFIPVTARTVRQAVEPSVHVSGMLITPILRRPIMTWSKPEFTDLRFGFEITMYISNR
jgi:coenzyme PQQ precursor peptide PqqA